MIYKRFTHLFCCLIVCPAFMHNLTAQHLIDDLKWLPGKWKLKSEHHRNQWEVWQSVENGWQGVSFLIQHGDTSVLE